MGAEWYTDAGDGVGGIYLYDPGFGAWFYTNWSTFPTLFDLTLDQWLWYLPSSTEPNHYTSDPRWFVNLTTNQWTSNEANTASVPIPPVTPNSLSINGGGNSASANPGTQTTFAFTYHDQANGATNIAGGQINFVYSGASYCNVSWTSSNQVSVQSGNCSATPISVVYSSTDLTAVTVTLGITLSSVPAVSYTVETFAQDKQGLDSSEGDVGQLTINQTYTLSGQVTLYPAYSIGATSGSPLTGLQVNLSGGASGSVTTDANGRYSFTVAAGGSYTVAPQSTAYSFAPSLMSVQNLTSNATLPFAAAAGELCAINTIVGQAITRTAGNQVTGSSTQYPTFILGNWTLTMTTTLLFTPSGGGAEQQIQQTTTSFNWSPSTETGSASTVTLNAVSAVQPYGAGSYRTRGDYSGVCGGQAVTGKDSPFYSSALTVQLPTITGFFNNNSFWNLGPNTSDPQPTTPSPSGQSRAYYQSVQLTFNSNCNPGDTCSDTPQWSLTTANNQTSLNATTGAVVTISKGSSPGDCNYDSTLSANIGGFATANYAVAVDSPKSLYHTAETTVAWENGYTTNWSFEVFDVCTPQTNVLLPVPISENFPGSGTPPQQFTNENSGTGYASVVPDNWDYTDWATPLTFIDEIGQMGYGQVPAVYFDNSAPPYTGNTVYFMGAHTFNAGSSTTGYGLLVYNGFIRFYTDHGDDNP